MKVGVSLPMGVKIPQAKIERLPSWKPQEDKLLHVYALKFGMNWHLVARALTDLEADFLRSIKSTVQPVKRSSKECKERWHFLATAKPELAIEAHNADLSAHKNARSISSSLKIPLDEKVVLLSMPKLEMMEESLAFSSHRQSLILPPPTTEKDKEVPEASIPPAETKQGESFVAFRRAAAKRREAPLAMPGVVSGQKPTLVPPHPSHLQSLQVAAAGTGGREMWPLQILDLADKQRAAAAAARAPQNAPSSHLRTSPSASPPRQSAAAQQFAPPPSNVPIQPSGTNSER
jgi:hypothetical protein